VLFNLALITSGTRIVIGNFHCDNALWLFDMPATISLLEIDRELPIEQKLLKATLVNHAQAILLKTRPNQP
jgi:hypothetical protein